MAKEDQLPKEEPKGPTTGMLHRKPSKTCPLCPVWGIPWDPMNPETFDKQHVYAERLWHEWEPGDKSGRWIGRVIEAAAELGIQVTPEQVKEHFSDRHKIEQPMMSGTLNHDRALYQAHHFSDRAQAVINAVYRQHVLTAKQIADVFYRPGRSANAARQAALVELSQLAQAHFLYRYYPSEADKSRRNTPPQFGKSVMFFLGRAAIPYIKERYDLGFQPNYLKRAREVKTETLLHDLKANSVFSSICEALTVRDREVEVEDASGNPEKIIVEAKPENWYGPGPQALTMAFVDPYEGVERRIMPDGFASLSVHRASSISPTQLPFFYEFDNGTRENQDVAEQMIAYHLLTLSRSALKRFPDLDIEGYAIPMLMVFSDRRRMERIAKRFREHAASLGLTNGAPILLASESDWNGDPFASGLVHSAWHGDEDPQAFMKLLIAASKPLTESQILSPDAVLRLDPRAASPTPGQTQSKKPQPSTGAPAPVAPTPPLPTPASAESADRPWIATPPLSTPAVPASEPWVAVPEPPAAPEPAAALEPSFVEEEIPVTSAPAGPQVNEVEDAADLSRRIIAAREYLAELEARLAQALNTEPLAEPPNEEPQPPAQAPAAPPPPLTAARPAPAVAPPAPMSAASTPAEPEAPAPAATTPSVEPPAPAAPGPETHAQPMPAVPAPPAVEPPPPPPAPGAAIPTQGALPGAPEPPVSTTPVVPEPSATRTEPIAMPSVPAALPAEEPVVQHGRPAPPGPISSIPAPLPADEPPAPEAVHQQETGFPDLDSEFGGAAPQTEPASAAEELDDVPLVPNTMAPPVEPGPVSEHDPLAPTGLDDIEDGPELIDLPDVLDGFERPPLPPDSPFVVGPDGATPASSRPAPAPAAPAVPVPQSAPPAPPTVPATPAPSAPPVAPPIPTPAGPTAPPAAPSPPDSFEEEDDMPSLHPNASAPARPHAADFASHDVTDAEDAQFEEPKREIEQRIAESAAARRKRRRKRAS